MKSLSKCVKKTYLFNLNTLSKTKRRNKASLKLWMVWKFNLKWNQILKMMARRKYLQCLWYLKVKTNIWERGSNESNQLDSANIFSVAQIIVTKFSRPRRVLAEAADARRCPGKIAQIFWLFQFSSISERCADQGARKELISFRRKCSMQSFRVLMIFEPFRLISKTFKFVSPRLFKQNAGNCVIK